MWLRAVVNMVERWSDERSVMLDDIVNCNFIWIRDESSGSFVKEDRVFDNLLSFVYVKHYF